MDDIKLAPNKETLEVIKPKEILRNGNVFELVTFEDSIEKLLQPYGVYGDKLSWPRRAPLANMLRPQEYRGSKYQGILFDISLESMEDPIEELAKARMQRNLIFSKGQSLNQKSFDSIVRSADGSIFGFNVSASGKSTGRNEFGIQSKIWYFRGQNSDIRRIVSEAKVDEELNNETVRNIGRVASLKVIAGRHSPIKASRIARR